MQDTGWASKIHTVQANDCVVLNKPLVKSTILAVISAIMTKENFLLYIPLTVENRTQLGDSYSYRIGLKMKAQSNATE